MAGLRAVVSSGSIGRRVVGGALRSLIWLYRLGSSLVVGGVKPRVVVLVETGWSSGVFKPGMVVFAFWVVVGCFSPGWWLFLLSYH